MIKNISLPAWFWLLVIVLSIVLTYSAYLTLLYKVNYPDLTMREHKYCIESPTVKSWGSFKTTRKGYCAKSNFCSDDGGFLFCERAKEKNMKGYRILDASQVYYFNFDHITMHESYEDNRPEKGWSYSEKNGISKNSAVLIDQNSETLLYWPGKGNGRFLSVDRESFEYLGNDEYRDREGTIVKNVRLK